MIIALSAKNKLGSVDGSILKPDDNNMGLNDSYTHIRRQILLMDPLPSVTRAFALVSQEEFQRGIDNRAMKTSEMTNQLS